MIKEGLKLNSRWFIHKFKDPDGSIERMLNAGVPVGLLQAYCESVGSFIGTEEIVGNTGLYEGITALIGLACGIGSETAWNAANARLGVGNGTAGESKSHSGLQGASKTFKAMDTNWPKCVGANSDTMEFQSTFGTGDANYAWEEFTVVNAADDTGKNLNRKVISKGTKASGETWVLVLQIQVA